MRLRLIFLALLIAVQLQPSGYVRAPELFGTAAYYGRPALALISNDWVTFVGVAGRFYQVGGNWIEDIEDAVPYERVGTRWFIDFRGSHRKLCWAYSVKNLQCK